MKTVTLARRIAVTPREAEDVEWAIDGMESSLHATPEEIDYASGDLPRLEAGVLVLGSSRGAEEDLRYRLVEQLRDMTIEEGGAERLPRLAGLARLNRKIWGEPWPVEVLA